MADNREHTEQALDLDALRAEYDPPSWTIDQEGTCDGCAESKHLILALDADEHNEPWLCADCAKEHRRIAALIDEVERLRSQITQLADELDNEADRHDPAKRRDSWRFSPEMTEAFRADATAKRDAARRVRALNPLEDK